MRPCRDAPAVELHQLPKRFCLLAEQVQLVRPSFITFSESRKLPHFENMS
jgi:hypothetical protein